MEFKFRVHNVPPKKDGANSMWRKKAELPRLKSLRTAALTALGNSSPLSVRAELFIAIYADPEYGDLDNFISGICDGLMAAHSNTPIDDESWSDIPSAAHPSKDILIRDDAIVEKIVAERRPQLGSDTWYEIEVRGE